MRDIHKLRVQVIAHLETRYNALCINIIVAGKSGYPDIIACIKGGFYGFELKTTKDRKKDSQTVKIHKIVLAGGKAGYVRCIKDVDNIINNEKYCLFVENVGLF